MARRGALLLLTLLSGLVLAGTAQASSPVERQIQDLFWTITWFAIGVSVVVYGVMFWFLYRYRQSVSPRRAEHLEGHRGVEIAWTVVPTIILVIITAVSIPVLFFTDTPPAHDTVVTVAAQRFSWTFTYEDGNSTSGELWFQEDVVVLFEVTSLDVIHSFAVHELGIKIDAVPGRVNHFWVRADDPGDYLVQCAEFCGVGHYGMAGSVHVYAAGTQPKIYGPPPEALTHTDVELREFGGNATAPWSISPSRLERPIGTEVRFRIWNNNSAARDFRVDAPVNETVAVPSFGSAWLNFTLSIASPDPIPYGPTSAAARANGMVGSLVVRSGRIITVLLDDAQAGAGHSWSVSPSVIEIDLGETIMFELRNIGSTVHNFAMGGVYEDVRCETLIPAGTTALCGPFVFDQGDAAGKYWCEVPGHRALGMEASYVVGEPTIVQERAVPIFEMALIGFSVCGVAMFAYVLQHARRRDA